jgi:hypothetical protein
VLVPDPFAAGDINAKEVVRHASDDGDFANALGCVDALGDERREEIVHFPWRARELDLP